MNTNVKRFLTFIRNEKTISFFAFALLYLAVVIRSFSPPPIINITFYIIQLHVYLIGLIKIVYNIYLKYFRDKTIKIHIKNMVKNIPQKANKIIKEIFIFFLVFTISSIMRYIFMNALSLNARSLNDQSVIEFYKEAPIRNSIYIVIIGPILEELIFRFLPYKFIKNKTLYIITSALLFSSIHVIADPYALFYIWFYMLTPLYFAYRYHKTKDIWVPISMHMFNNLICVFTFLISVS